MREGHHCWTPPEIATAFLTFGILGAGLLQACIYWRQSDIMSKSLQQNGDSIIIGRGQLAVAARNASTAEKSLGATVGNFQMDQRAWVGLRAEPTITFFAPPVPEGQPPAEPFENPYFTVTIANYGKSPAHKVSVAIDEAFLDGADAELPSNPSFRKEFTSVVASIFPNQPPVISKKAGIDTSGGMLKELYAQTKTLNLYGEITYTDIFKKKRYTQFCYHYIAYKLGINFGSLHYELTSCKNYNESH